MTLPLDSYDRKLLAAVQCDARIAQHDLGAQVNLSTAAVNRRLKRLSEAGVIERYTAQLSPDALGHPLTIVATVEVESEHIDLLDAMKQGFQACPQVQQCYYVTGEWDFVLVLTVRSMAQYHQLTRELFFASHNVKRFKTLVTMNRIKSSMEVPVDDID